MKWIAHTLIVSSIALLPVSMAQPPEGRMHDGRGFERLEPPPDAPLQDWMQRLKNEEPEEFQRLQALRIRNPEQFRKETKSRLIDEGLTRLKEHRPAVYEAITSLPEDDQRWLAERLLRSRPGQPERSFSRDKGPPGGPPMIERSLIRQYRKADDEQTKQHIRLEIRQKLESAYDLQLQQRRKQLAEAEKQLEAVRSAIIRGEEEKAAFIEQKLEIWLDHPSVNSERDDAPR